MGRVCPPGGEDHVFYRAPADQIDARSSMDLGCGTRLLTRSLQRPGRTMIGVDSSRTMLDYARRHGIRCLEHAIRWASHIDKPV